MEFMSARINKLKVEQFMNRPALYPTDNHVVTLSKAKGLFLDSSATPQNDIIKQPTTTAGQSFTEFIIIFPVLLLMLSSVLFFTRLLVLKQRTVSAVRYVAWYAGRHDGNEPSANALKALFFNKSSTLLISHPEPDIGFAGNSLGDLVDVLGKVAGIQGTAIDVTGCNYPFSSIIAHTGARHFVFMDTWKESGITGKALKYGLWAIAVAKGFQNGSGSSSGNGGNTSIDLENPSIFGN